MHKHNKYHDINADRLKTVGISGNLSWKAAWIFIKNVLVKTKTKQETKACSLWCWFSSSNCVVLFVDLLSQVTRIAAESSGYVTCFKVTLLQWAKCWWFSSWDLVLPRRKALCVSGILVDLFFLFTCLHSMWLEMDLKQNSFLIAALIATFKMT